MRFSANPIAQVVLLALGASTPARSQGGPPEVDELRRRVAVMRSQLPQITLLADKYAAFLGYDGSGRFVISRQIDPAFYLEFQGRAGGPPDTQDADVGAAAGLALLPVRHWDGTGLGVAGNVEKFWAQGRPVLLVGPANGRPEPLLNGVPIIDDGAPNGDRTNASINGIANLIVAWVFYSEVVAAATRAGWQPGVLLSVLISGSTPHNDRAKFRMPGPAPERIPGGRLGALYLDTLDSILALAAAPDHRTLMDTVAARIRLLRGGGKTVYAGSCGHYLLEEIPRDAGTSTTFSVLPGAGTATAAPARAPTPVPGDVMIWFGYGGYDCPNIRVAESFHRLGLKVVLASDALPPNGSQDVLAEIQLPWQLPDGVVPLPFSPGRVAPISSVDMAMHYLWLRRLLTAP